MRTAFQSLRLALGASVAAGTLGLVAFGAFAQEPPAAPPPVVLPIKPVPPQNRPETRPPDVITPVPPPIVTRLPPSPPRPRMMVVNPSWMRAPIGEFPERALVRDVTEGLATLMCVVTPDGRLSDCQVTTEIPVGFGFGDAALASTAQARVSPATVGAAAPGAQASFTIRFRMAPEPPRLSIIEDPSWARPPRAAFPRSARNAGITAARVRLDCEIRGDGRLQKCMVKEEDPTGHRFGEAAIRAARDASVSPLSLYQVAPYARAVFTVTFTR